MDTNPSSKLKSLFLCRHLGDAGTGREFLLALVTHNTAWDSINVLLVVLMHGQVVEVGGSSSPALLSADKTRHLVLLIQRRDGTHSVRFSGADEAPRTMLVQGVVGLHSLEDSVGSGQ